MPVQQVSFADLFTVSGGANGTMVNSAGLIVPFAEPGIDYDPITREVRGLLVEVNVANRCQYSSDFSNAAHVKVRSSIVANATTAPDGTLTADKLVEDTSVTNSHYINGPYSAPATLPALSVFAKAAERTRITFQPILDNGAAVAGTLSTIDLAAGVVVSGPAAIEPFPNGWFRISAMATVAGTTNYAARVALDNGAGFSYTGDGASGAFLWGMQHETAGGLTGYIPVPATSAITRAGRVVKIDLAKFAQLYRQGEGTLFVRFMPRYAPPFTTGGRLLSVSDGTINNRILMVHGTNNLSRSVVVDGGPSTVDQFALSPSIGLGVSNTMALTFKNNEVRHCLNGGAVVSDTVATIPLVVNKLNFGADATEVGQQAGWLQDVLYIPKATPAAELPSLGARIDAWRAGGRRSW